MKITVDLQDFGGIETLIEVLKTYSDKAQASNTQVTDVQFNTTPIQQDQEQTAPVQQSPNQQAPQGAVPQQQIVQQPTYAPQPMNQPPNQGVVPQQPIPQQQQPIQQTLQTMPTATQSFTMDQLAVAATQLIDAGRIAEIQQLLAQFGVQALTVLPKEQYGAFATALRGLGAKL